MACPPATHLWAPLVVSFAFGRWQVFFRGEAFPYCFCPPFPPFFPLPSGKTVLFPLVLFFSWLAFPVPWSLSLFADRLLVKTAFPFFLLFFFSFCQRLSTHRLFLE